MHSCCGLSSHSFPATHVVRSPHTLQSFVTTSHTPNSTQAAHTPGALQIEPLEHSHPITPQSHNLCQRLHLRFVSAIWPSVWGMEAGLGKVTWSFLSLWWTVCDLDQRSLGITLNANGANTSTPYFCCQAAHHQEEAPLQPLRPALSSGPQPGLPKNHMVLVLQPLTPDHSLDHVEFLSFLTVPPRLRTKALGKCAWREQNEWKERCPHLGGRREKGARKSHRVNDLALKQTRVKCGIRVPRDMRH